MAEKFTYGYTAEQFKKFTKHAWLMLLSFGLTYLFFYNGRQNINLVLPLRRVKSQTEQLSAHDLTVQVRMDTMALRLKLPKGGESWVLWCDVDHVYEREDFVEIVHNKKASLFIPKRCIPDLNELDAIVKRCRGEQ